MKFVLIKNIHLFIRKIPLNLVLLLAYPIGIIYYFFTPIQNFRISKRKNFIEGYSVLKVKINYVKYWIETIWLTKTGYQKYVEPLVEIINGEEISKLNNSFNSYIIALPHVGNWEFAIPQGKGLGLNLLAVAEPLEDKKILNWFTSLREDLGCKIILGGKGQNTFDKVIRKLEEGYHICLLSDRHVGKSGVGVEFFNNMAAFPKGPVSIALKTQLPIIPATFLKKDNKYKLIFGNPFFVPHFENEAQSIQHGLKILSKQLEDLIKLDPNQWHSIQPIWTSEY